MPREPPVMRAVRPASERGMPVGSVGMGRVSLTEYGGGKRPKGYLIVRRISMKIAVLVARILLGLIFTFFGSNMLFHFLPTPPLTGDVATMSRLMAVHGWIY